MDSPPEPAAALEIVPLYGDIPKRLGGEDRHEDSQKDKWTTGKGGAVVHRRSLEEAVAGRAAQRMVRASCGPAEEPGVCEW